MGTLFFVDFDTIAGIKCCCRQDSFSVISPKKPSASFWGWIADYVEKVCYYFTHWDGGTIHLYWCQYCETKKMLVNMFLFHLLFSMTLEKTSHKNSIQYTTYGIRLFYLLCFKPKTSFKDLPILMRKLLLFCDILPGIRTIKIPSGF